MSLGEVVEAPHFHKTSFRVRGKIFLTVDKESMLASCKLPPELQEVYSKAAESIVFPVPNKWGKQGWTHIELKKVTKSLLKEMLLISMETVSPTQPGTSRKKRNK